MSPVRSRSPAPIQSTICGIPLQACPPFALRLHHRRLFHLIERFEASLHGNLSVDILAHVEAVSQPVGQPLGIYVQLFHDACVSPPHHREVGPSSPTANSRGRMLRRQTFSFARASCALRRKTKACGSYPPRTPATTSQYPLEVRQEDPSLHTDWLVLGVSILHDAPAARFRRNFPITALR